MFAERHMGVFTPRAAHAFVTAIEAAKERAHPLVEIPHLLLGLMKEKYSISQIVLDELEVNETRIIEFIERTVKVDSLKPGIRPVLSPSITPVFNIAAQESQRELRAVKQALGEVIENADCNLSPEAKRLLEITRSRILADYSIGTEHLLLGSARKTEGTDGDLLRFLNVSQEGLRERIYRARLSMARR